MVRGDTKVTVAKGDARGGHGQGDVEGGHGSRGCNCVHELREHTRGQGGSVLAGSCHLRKT